MDAIFLSMLFLFHGLFVESLVNFRERDGKMLTKTIFLVTKLACSFHDFFLCFSITTKKRLISNSVVKIVVVRRRTKNEKLRRYAFDLLPTIEILRLSYVRTDSRRVASQQFDH